MTSLAMRNGRDLLALAATLLILMLAPLSAARAEAEHGLRLALVIGNSQYHSVPQLKNAAADAGLVAQTLTDLGFQVTLLENASLADMKAAVTEIKKRGKGAEAVLFYYSGHGFQLQGSNFLVPTEAVLTDRGRIEEETLQLDDIIDQLADASRATIIMLDACRDNPLPPNVRGTDVLNGLAQVNANVPNTYVLFSTGPGNVSHDGEGNNGPFALALQAKLTLPDQDFISVMKQVRKDVAKRTDGLQLPWEQSSMFDDFKFNIGLPPGTLVAGLQSLPVIPLVADTGPALQLLPDGPPPEGFTEQVADIGNLLIGDVPDNLIAGTQVPPTDATRTVSPIEDPGLSAQEPEIKTLPVPDTTPEPTPTTEVASVDPKQVLAPIGAPVSPGQDTSSLGPVPPVTPPAEAALDPLKVAELVQNELKRVGCYSGVVDGDWGNGSRKALKKYFDAKKASPTTTEPTIELKTALAAETGVICKAEPAPVKKQPVVADGGTPAPKKQQPSTQEPAAPKKPSGGLQIKPGSGSFR